MPAPARLGQGFPGGRAALGGLDSIPDTPIGGGGLSSIPDVGSSPRTLSPRPVSTPPTSFTPTVAPEEDLAEKARRLAQANRILRQVTDGMMEPTEARAHLDSLITNDAERADLTKSILHRQAIKGGDYRPELQALRFAPLGKDPGAQTQSGKGAGLGIGSNLVRDLGDSVVGFIPAMGLSAKAGAQDYLDFLRHPGQTAVAALHGDTHTEREIIGPMLHEKAYQYGPLLPGGTPIQESGRRISEHPLGPVMDVAALASMGIGGAARTAEALSAVRAGETTEVASIPQAQASRNAALAAGNRKGRAPKVTQVGPDHSVHLGNNGFEVRNQGRIVGQGYVDHETAVKVAQVEASGVSGGNLARAIKGATRKGQRGSLVDAYEKVANVSHDKEIEAYGNEVMDVLDDPKLRLTRKTRKDIWHEVKEDLKATRTRDFSKPYDLAHHQPQFFSQGGMRALGTASTAVGVTLREASDLIRAGAIYLRAAYIPNNWTANLFMNSIQQGFLAPLHLAKSFAMSDHLGPRYTAALRQSMGQNAAQVVAASKGRGYIASAINPVAHTMGAIADQPFRDAAFLHEARKAGYRNLGQVKELFDRAAVKDEAARRPALNEIGEIARRAQNEIVKFGRMNNEERQVIRNLVFVYSWMKGASIYAARFGAHHPIQANIYGTAGRTVGQPYLEDEFGNVPNYMLGAVPIGRTDKGDPIVINPFALNPLGTGYDMMRAAIGTGQVLQGDKAFNKFAGTDLVNLLNPLVGNYLEAREGGRGVVQTALDTIAPTRLAHDLRHPGQGSVYPTTRKEAIGRFTLGSLYPRVADRAAITRSFIRENEQHPEKLIPLQVHQFEELTGQHVPPELIRAYRQDIHQVKQERDFQHNYAKGKGQQGFTNLPATNRAKAAIEYLEKYHKVTPKEITDMRKQLDDLPNEYVTNLFANALWKITGAGRMSRRWDDLMRRITVESDERTREKP